MNMIGCLDVPSDGTIISKVSLCLHWMMTACPGSESKDWFCFPTFNLLPRATALANVELPLRYAGKNGSRKKMAQDALEAVGLGDRIYHQPMSFWRATAASCDCPCYCY